MPHLTAATRRAAIVALREAADHLILANATAFDKTAQDANADRAIFEACALLGLECRHPETDAQAMHEAAIARRVAEDIHVVEYR
jgi:hypothetical protein